MDLLISMLLEKKQTIDKGKKWMSMIYILNLVLGQVLRMV